MVKSFDYLVVKDPHFMFGFRNNIRKHGWERHIDNKLDQIIDYAGANSIQNIFFTGDVFEKSHRKDWSLNQMQQNKARLLKFKKAGLTVYSNMGNHDYFDGHEGPEGTVFGEMVDLELIKYVGSRTAAVDFQVDGNYVSLYGIDHHQSMDVILDRLGWISAQPKVGPKIILMHSNVTDSQTRLTDFTYQQLSGYDVDIINCGHWHLQPEHGSIQELNNTYFLNPWNLTRVMRDYHVKLDEHKPSFIHANIVFVAGEPQYSFKEIVLNVQPFSEAFNTEVINLLQELGKDGFKFFKDVSLEQDEDLNDDESLIEAIAKANQISENSIIIAKDLLT